MDFLSGTFYSRLSTICAGAIFFLSSLAGGSPSSLNYQGRILKADGTPLVYSNVAFIFQIKGGTNGQCLIYQEQINGIDLSGSAGVFDVPIGVGSTQYPTSGSFTVLDAFNNSTPSFTCGICTSSSCSASTSTYTPNSDDIRYLRVQFYDGTGWRLISPDSVIRSVPFAGYSLSAQKLGTHSASEFIFKDDVNNPGSGSVSCSGGGNFLTWDASTGKFGCDAVSGASGGTVTNVTASSPLAVTNGTSTPNITIQVASGSQSGYLSSSDWTTFNNKLSASTIFVGDVSGTASTTSVDKLKGTALNISSLSSNQVLKYSGGNWINSTLTTSDISGLSTTLSGLVAQSQFPASCAANQTLTFVSPSSSFTCSSIAISGAQVSGNIAGNAAGFTGSLAGDVSGTQGATSVDKIKGVTISATTPTANQVLTYTGGSWTPTNLPSSLSGSGTAGYVPYYSASTTLTNSNIYNSGSNVGVGTTSPSSSLTVNGRIESKAGLLLSQGSGGTDNLIYIQSPNPGAIDGSLGFFAAGAGSGSAYDGSYFLGRGNNFSALPNQRGNLYFTAGNPTSPGTNEGSINFWTGNEQPRLTIDHMGDVGIGTTSPLGKLTIFDDGYDGISNIMTASSLPGFNITAGSDYMGLSLLDRDGNMTTLDDKDGMIYWGDNTDDNLRFASVTSNQATTRLIITGAGSVGIGTTAPAHALDVIGDIKGTQLCIDADCRSAWPSGAGGTVTSVTGGAGLTGGTITGSGTLAVDVGTTANKIVQLDSSAKLPAVDGSALTNLNATNLTTGTLPAARMPGLAGDVTSTAGTTTTTLAQIQGKALTISSLATGDYLKYNGTGWINDPLSSADLSDASSLIKSSQMPANCAAGQTLTFSSPTGSWTCSNIVVTASNFGSQTQNTFLAAPNGSNGTPTFRTIAAADLPSGTLSGSGTAGYVPYYSGTNTLASSSIYYSGGMVGLGTTTPGVALDIIGSLRTSAKNTNAVMPAFELNQDNAVTTTGVYYNRGGTIFNATTINGGTTNNGYQIGLWIQNMRNQSSNADNGTLTRQEGIELVYGHYNIDPSATPVTNDAMGMIINPYSNTGTINNMYDLYLSSGSGGAVVNNHWGIFQSSPLVQNYFAGNIGIGTSLPSNKLEVVGGTTKLEQEPWTYPSSFGGSWVNYGATYGNFGYRKDSMGYLRLRGLLKGGVIGTSIFTLPVGYRPTTSLEFSISASNGSNPGTANVIINTAGQITIETMSSNSWISFDNVSIPLD